MKSCWIGVTSLMLFASSWCGAAEVHEARGDALDRRISKLIEQLGDSQFPVRERAQQELVQLGYEAFDALSDAENNDDPEIAAQASYLVRLIRVDWTREGDPRQIQVIFKDYESLPDERRLLRIRQLADLPDDQGLEWLCRLVRFEKSHVLSKQAALAVMNQESPRDDAAWARRAKTIAKSLERGRRPATRWLTTYVQAQADPAGALPAWTALTEAERQTLEHHPQETQNQIVRELLRRKIDLLDRLGQSDEIQGVMHQMVLCERGDSASLTELVDWLAKRKAWTVVDEVATRFAASFETDSLLLYTLCEARVAQGNRESAERTAEQALKLGGDSALEHKSVAKALLDRGLIEWSDRELRYIIQLGPIASPLAIEARLHLSQSLHDRALDRQAAEALQGLIEAMDTDMNVVQQVREILQDRPPGMIRARFFHYLACDAESKKEIAKQREYLDKALEQDKADVDALISAYRLSAADAKWRADVIELVKKAVDETRRAIEDAPDDPTNYNQLAWLVANTEGDLDEAIRLSQKSVDLARSSATTQEEFRSVSMYLDTLAHCYFAQKDFANAVKYQAEAVKLDPHSAPIGRQLKTFRQALTDAQSSSGK